MRNRESEGFQAPQTWSQIIKERKQRAYNFALKMRREIEGMKADKLSQRQIS